ncbi:MAG TPA: heme-binding domain-containing protein [Pseudomonadales bacterium]|nr:heme-binding domain-containing protein [Pseudomonadales bacterium]
MNFLKKNLKWIFIGVAALFAALQFTNPPHTNPPVKNDFLARMNPPPKIAAMFRSACYDCHSDETRWPWYSDIAPMSWKIAQDVNVGRSQLNLSEWPSDNPKRAWKKLETMSEDIDQKDMPLKKYTLIHKDARLTDEQRDELTQWLDKQVDMLKSQGGAE